MVNDQPGRFPVGVAERIDRSKEPVRHVRMHAINTLIKKQMVQENVHFAQLIGTIVLSRQRLFCAFWKMGGIKPCPLNFHLHQASGGGMVITFNKGRARAGSQRAASVRRPQPCRNADVQNWGETASAACV